MALPGNGVLVSGGGEAPILAFADSFSGHPHVTEGGAGKDAQNWLWEACGGQLQLTGDCIDTGVSVSS